MAKQVRRKRATPALAKARAAHLGRAVVVSQPRERDFKPDGLRPYFLYRNLGIARATKGRIGAHVIRARKAVKGGQGRHTHTLGFQMVYVLKGKARFWYDAFGTVEVVAGSAVYQPPGILHEMLSCSRNCEILEITMPAEFATQAA
jgi:uncharacterized RmlC-like cupin family protein